MKFFQGEEEERAVADDGTAEAGRGAARVDAVDQAEHAAVEPARVLGEADRDPALVDLEQPGEDGFLDDPLGIATPWEAKKKDAAS